jgi:hypothetical protein
VGTAKAGRDRAAVFQRRGNTPYFWRASTLSLSDGVSQRWREHRPRLSLLAYARGTRACARPRPHVCAAASTQLARPGKFMPVTGRPRPPELGVFQCQALGSGLVRVRARLATGLVSSSRTHLARSIPYFNTMYAVSAIKWLLRSSHRRPQALKPSWSHTIHTVAQGGS